jgi:hypothetical protein
LHFGDLREQVAFPSAWPAPGPRRAGAFSSWARSLIAARSSSVNTLDALPLAGFCESFMAVMLMTRRRGDF